MSYKVHKVYKFHKALSVLLALWGMNFIASCSLFAQSVNINATLDSASIMIGNRAHIKLALTYDVRKGPVKIQWPQIGDSLVSKVGVLRKSKIDTVIPDSTVPTTMRQIQNLTITSYDSGYYVIPPFSFIINGDTAHKLSSETMLLQVRTIPIDTTKGYKDIKGPIQARLSWLGGLLEALPYIGWGMIGLLVAALIFYFTMRYLKNKKPVPVTIEGPPIPADIKALRALEELAMKKLWQEGKIKEYHSGITDILREYIDARFHISAIEMTTDEIMVALKNKDLSEQQKKNLRQVMVLSDLVKFAKESPIQQEHENSLNFSIDFVKETAEIPVSSPPPNEPAPERPVYHQGGAQPYPANDPNTLNSESKNTIA